MCSNTCSNYKKVIAGTLYLDAVKDNDKSHYTDINRGNDNISHVRSKVEVSIIDFDKYTKKIKEYQSNIKP